MRRTDSVSSEDAVESETSTHHWVRQQQIVGVAGTGGKSLQAVVQRRLFDHDDSADQNLDLASLTMDVDESIDQLNKLIMDLDPTFVPVETSCSPLSRTASDRSSDLGRKRNNHLSGRLGFKVPDN